MKLTIAKENLHLYSQYYFKQTTLKGGMKVKIRGNEHGNALLMVLMVVVVFTILGVGLLSMNASASKQFDKKEEQVQARHRRRWGFYIIRPGSK